MVPNFYDYSVSYFLMSGSVWYVSVSKKKIEFKRYPKKKKKSGGKSHLTKFSKGGRNERI